MDNLGPDAAKTVDIRKYSNRRYYDATHSRHVTLEEIRALIQDGCDVKVTDPKTGEDLTGKVLTQIMLDLDPLKLEVFPAALLHRIIRSNEQIVKDFVNKYFSQAFTSFLGSQRQFESYLRQAIGLGGEHPAVPDFARIMMGPFSPDFWSGAGRKEEAAASPAPAAVGESDDLRATVEELRKQVQSLQSKLKTDRP